MNRAIAAGVIVASLALAGPAGAATPTERKLQRQVTTLRKDVATLKKDVKTLKAKAAQSEQIENALAALVFCSAAIAADTFQATWLVDDQKAGGPVIGPQQAVNDAGACNAFTIARSGAAPPNLNVFHAFFRILALRSLFNF